jgi:hypothetical protein
MSPDRYDGVVHRIAIGWSCARDHDLDLTFNV